MTKLINSVDFEQEVISSDVPVVVDFFATWCGPCKMIAPVLDQLADEFQGQAKVVKLDVDQAKETATQYNIRTVPTLLFFKDGEIVDKVVGALPKSELKQRISPLV